MILKLQIVVELDGDLMYKDFYIEASSIFGFYVDDEDVIGDEAHNHVIIYAGGNSYSVKPEKHVTDYLMDRFVTPAL